MDSEIGNIIGSVKRMIDFKYKKGDNMDMNVETVRNRKVLSIDSVTKGSEMKPVNDKKLNENVSAKQPIKSTEEKKKCEIARNSDDIVEFHRENKIEKVGENKDPSKPKEQLSGVIVKEETKKKEGSSITKHIETSREGELDKDRLPRFKTKTETNFALCNESDQFLRIKFLKGKGISNDVANLVTDKKAYCKKCCSIQYNHSTDCISFC